MDAPKSSRRFLEDERRLWSYLNFGYLPEVNSSEPFGILADWDRHAQHLGGADEPQPPINAAVRILKTMAQPTVPGDGMHVVLLSGGFDSRAILGTLLEVLHPSRIVTCTYGIAGNEEIELAARVAQVAGVEHMRIDIVKAHWTTNELLNSVRHRSYPPSFVLGARFHNYNIYRHFGPDCVFWDGFLGDALTGAHLGSDASVSDWDVAIARFVQKNSRARRMLAPPDFDPRTALPSEPFCTPEALSFDDQLDLAVRQGRYISNRLSTDYNIATPFSRVDSWRFWLGLPRRFRREQLLYRLALGKAYPALFSIPVAGGRSTTPTTSWQRMAKSFARRASVKTMRMLGKQSARSDPHGSIGDQMRHNSSLRNVVQENIADLEERRLITWVSPTKILSDHMSGKTNNTEAIRILVSLEIAAKLAS